jgi:hypothetical protein
MAVFGQPRGKLFKGQAVNGWLLHSLSSFREKNVNVLIIPQFLAENNRIDARFAMFYF